MDDASQRKLAHLKRVNEMRKNLAMKMRAEERAERRQLNSLIIAYFDDNRDVCLP